MGVCCSCHRGGRLLAGYSHTEGDRPRRGIDDGNIVMRGDAGARVRLHGSSKYVSMFTQQGKKGFNQDSMTSWENFSGDKDMVLCAVFDGHGPAGHKVSRYIREFLPAKISMMYRKPCIDDSNPIIDILTDDGPKNPLFLSWKARIIKCYHDMDEQLEGDSSVESYCSGTTSVCVIKKGEHLIISNLGDSRAVLCKKDGDKQLVSEQLTVDLKPNLPSEAERIRGCAGRVMAREGEPHIFRVWMPKEDCPGLAMARAFGDFCLKDYGIISTPQVTYRRITDADEFVVLATDGIWDALSNDEVIAIVSSASNRSTAAKLLVEQARWAWRYKYPRSKIDDCAVICLFFKSQKAASLTKSVSEMAHLNLNCKDLDVEGHTGSMQSEDAMDTVLNYKMEEESREGEGSNLKRPSRRKTGRRLEVVGE